MKLPQFNIKKTTGFVLSVALLATQSVFAYQPEKSFWAERRQATRRNPSAVLASLPLSSRGGESLAAQFPSPQILRSSLSQSVVRSVPHSFLKSHADLLAALSSAHGSVRKVSLGRSPALRGPVVIHIQDVHMNAEAQKNIRDNVAGLLKSGQVGLVALEGSTEGIALQPFVDFPNRKAVELTADYLLKENKISGPIHAAMTAQGKLPRILGIDDPAHYAANVQAYKDSAPKFEEARRAVKTRQSEIEEQKKTVFSPPLLALDQTVTGYRNEKISLGDYVEVLAKNSKGFRVVELFLKALRVERTLDFKQVEAERSKLIDKLTRTLNTQEISALMAQSLAYRTGELGYGDFYGQLKETCQKNGIRLSDYPAMDEYIRYVLLANSIDAESLLNEISSMEKAAYDRLAKTSEEKALAAQSRQTWLTTKLVDFALTPSEWGEYNVLPRAKSFDRSSFENFYREAESRDTLMANNLLTALSQQSNSGSASASIALLVTGGFHAEGMAKELTEKGAIVISYVPKIEKVDTAQGSSYLSVFTQEKTPLEKLFQGEKLFLAASPISRNNRTTLGPALVAMLGVLLIGQTGGVDLNAVYSALGGVGILAGLKIVHDTVQAKLIVDRNTVNVKVEMDGHGILRVAQSIKKEYLRLSAITAFLKSQFSQAQRINPRQLLRELIFLSPALTQILLGWMIDPTMGPWALFMSSLTPLALTLPVFLLYHWNVFNDLLGKIPMDQSIGRVAAVYFFYVAMGYVSFGLGAAGPLSFFFGSMTSETISSNILSALVSVFGGLVSGFGLHWLGNQILHIPATAVGFDEKPARIRKLVNEGNEFVKNGKRSEAERSFREAVQEFQEIIKIRQFILNDDDGNLGGDLSLWVENSGTSEIFVRDAGRVARHKTIRGKEIKKLLLSSLFLSSGYFMKSPPESFLAEKRIKKQTKFPKLSDMTKKGYLHEINGKRETLSRPSLFENEQNGQKFVVKFLGQRAFSDNLGLRLFRLFGFSVVDTRPINEIPGMVITPWIDGTITLGDYLHAHLVDPTLFRPEAISRKMFPSHFREMLEGSKLISMIIDLQDFNLGNVLLRVDENKNLLPYPPIFFDFELTFFYKINFGMGPRIIRKPYRDGFSHENFFSNADTNRYKEPLFHRNSSPSGIRWLRERLINVSKEDIQANVHGAIEEWANLNPLGELGISEKEIVDRIMGGIKSAISITKAPLDTPHATGWWGVMFTYFSAEILWWMGKRGGKGEPSHSEFVKGFVKSHAASVEDVVNAMVSVLVGFVSGQKVDVLSWLSLGTLSPPLAIVFSVGLIVGIWFALFVVSHLIAPIKLETITGKMPSVKKLIRLFGSYVVPLIVSALLGNALQDLWVPVIIIALSGFQLLVFPWVRARHNSINLTGDNPPAGSKASLIEKPSFLKWEIISPFVGPLFMFFSYVRFMDTDTKTSWAYKIFDFPWFETINNGYINDLISIPTVWALFFTVASVVNILIGIFKNFFEKKSTQTDQSILGNDAKRKNKITSIVFEAGVFFSLMIGGFLAFNEANSRLFDAMRLLYHSLSDFDGVYRAGVYGGGDILSFLRMFSGTFDPVDLMIFTFEGAASFSFIPVLFYTLPAFRSTVEASQKRRQSPLVSLIATLLKWDALKLNNGKDTIQSPGTDYSRISGIVLKVVIVTIVLGSVAFVWSIASPWVEFLFVEVPKIDAQSATILGAAGFLQGFVPKTPKEAGEQAAWALVAQSANIQGALESVIPVVQSDHSDQIVGKGLPSADSLSTILSRVKNDEEFRAGFVGAIRTVMEQGNLSPMQMNLLSVLIKGATGQPVAFLHILGKTPKNELATLESLVERADPTEKSGLSVALVVSVGQVPDVMARIEALKAKGVQVFEVTLGSEVWGGDALRTLERKMSTWLDQANGIVATVGTKVGIDPKDIEALQKESKLREALKNAMTLGESIEIFLRYLQVLASNA